MACLLAGLAIFKASSVFAQIQVPTCTATVDDLDFGDNCSPLSFVRNSTPETSAQFTVSATVPYPPPGFSKAFPSFTIDRGSITTLTYTIDNSGNDTDVTDLAFTDSLPSALVLTDTPSVDNNCGGTLTAPAGGRAIAFSGGRVGANAMCEIPVSVRGIESGYLFFTTSDLTSSITTAAGAFTDLFVRVDAPGFTKAFSPDTVPLGTLSRLTYTIDNSRNAFGLDFQFLDDFPNGLFPAPIPNVSSDCGGTFSFDAENSISAFRFEGSVRLGQTCTVSLDMQGRQFSNGVIESVSRELTSNFAAPAPGARAFLSITAVPLSVSMAFSPARITPGGVSRLTYRLRNNTSIPVIRTFLRDVLPAGVVVAAQPNAETTCPNFDFNFFNLFAAAGNDEITLAASFDESSVLSTIIDECTASVDVTSAVPGSYPNVTGFITSSSHGNSPPAEATLTVVDAPGFAKAFSPPAVDPGGVSTLTFTIDNAANLIEVGSLAFNDNFPDGMIVAPDPDTQTTCTGGTISAAAGGASVGYSGGGVAAGASCTVSVDVQAVGLVGPLENISGALTSDLPDDAPGAAATLTVNDAPLIVLMEFTPSTIAQSGVSRLSYTLSNGAAIAATEVSLTDTLPANVALAAAPDARTTCTGGTLTAAAGGNQISYSGGAVAAGDACAISVDVTSSVAGSYPNATEELTSALGDSTPAEATLTVVDAPVFSKAFSPATIDQGEVSTLTFTIDNGANLIDVGPLAFTDNFPDGMIVATPPNTTTSCGDGTVFRRPGSSTVSLTDGAVAAGASCTVSVDVRGLRSGTLENISGELTSNLPDAAPPALATLTVGEAPLIVSMEFSPSTIAQGGISTLSYTLSNGAAIAATEVSLTDMLPANVVVADAPAAQTSCGGTFNPGAGDTALTFTDGNLAAGGTCAISVDVTSAVAGSYSNGPEAVTSSLGDSTPALATLTVDAADALVFSKEFSPPAVDPGRVSTLTFTIDNGANLIDVGSLAFTDAFPDGIAVADTPAVNNDCGGGTFAPGASDVSLSFAGGAVAAGAICTISVDVQAVGLAGAQRNVSGALTSDLPVSTPGAEATLTINEVPLLATMAFDPPEIDPGEISTLTYTLENRTGIEGAAPISLLDMLPADVVVADVPDARTTCGGGTLTADPPDPIETASIVYSGGSLAADSTCTISVDVTSAVAGSYSNATEELTSSLGVSTPASATLTVGEAPLIVSMGFSPSTIAQGGVSRLSYGLRNDAAVGATSISLSDTLPADVVVAGVPDASTTCGGGTVTAAAGGDTVAFADGELAAGVSCTISVDVTSAVAGSYSNGPEAVTSSLGASTPVQATLTVDAADAPVFTKAFSPDTIAPGGISRLTFTIDNGANLIDVGSLAFTDAFPSGLVVAGTPNGSTTCGGTFAPGASDVSLAFAGGAVAAGDACAISVDVTSAVAGSYPNTSGALTSDVPDAAPPALATLTVDEAPLVVLMEFSPSTIAQGGVSRLSVWQRCGGRGDVDFAVRYAAGRCGCGGRPGRIDDLRRRDGDGGCGRRHDRLCRR